MFLSLRRISSPLKTYLWKSTRFLNQFAPIVKGKYGLDQIEYIKSAIEENRPDWSVVKNNVLIRQGNINDRNIDGVLLKTMINSKKLDAALSFANYLKQSSEELTLGSINGLIGLYYEVGKVRELSDNEMQFILDTHKSLYKRYKVLDYATCERLLHALCGIDEWEKALKVLDNIQLSTTPSHSAYSTLIATLFRKNKKNDALVVIQRSLNDKRHLQHNAYEEWISYIMRKYKEKKTIIKYLDEICVHISMNCAIITMETATKLKEVYNKLGWSVNFSKIRKQNGECSCCKEKLNCLILSPEEFLALQCNVKEKLIVGSDLFLKTSPSELSRFYKFLEKTAPYDIVLDALNIAYAVGKGHHMDRMNLLHNVVDHFTKQNKKILLLGRKHMLNWPKRSMEQLRMKTNSFFTDNISEDDPYFITAAILSGSHTDIVSKDLLRGHKFLMKDERLRQLFKRWQWQHQWMVFHNINNGYVIQPPLRFTPCAQKKNDCWHLPYDNEESKPMGQVNDGTPDLSSWLCLRPIKS